MSLDGALFDIGKLNFFAKEILAKKNKDQIFEMVVSYATKYQPKLLEVVNRNHSYFKEIMNIEREKENPRKDYDKFGNLLESISFFYDDFYEDLFKEKLPFSERLSPSLIKDVLHSIKENLSLEQDEQSWFSQLKQIGESLGFAPSGKLYKNNPDQYVGSVADIAEILRIALTGKKNSPNLFYVMKVLGKSHCDKRIERVISSF
jgi:glutamyl-tRNA synthetase